jgi:hypothetical protein
MNVDHFIRMFLSFNLSLGESDISVKNKYSNTLFNGKANALWHSKETLVNFIRRLNKH